MLLDRGLQLDVGALLAEQLRALVDNDVGVSVFHDVDECRAELRLEAGHELDRQGKVAALADGADVPGAVALGLLGDFAIGDALLGALDHADHSLLLTGSEAAPVAQALEHFAEELAERRLHQRVRDVQDGPAVCVAHFGRSKFAILTKKITAQGDDLLAALRNPAGACALGAVRHDARLSGRDVGDFVLDIVGNGDVGEAACVAHIDLHKVRSSATMTYQ